MTIHREREGEREDEEMKGRNDGDNAIVVVVA